MVRKTKPKPVTILIGILCKDTIVLSSDSQTSYEVSKRRDTEKIRVVRFKDNNALVAQAGGSDTSDRIIDVLSNLSGVVRLDDPETAIGLMQRAMMSVREEIRRQHLNCSAEELRQIFINEGLDCDLMMAHHCNRKPFLHCFNFQSGRCRSIKAIYESIGIGAPLANYLLAELCTPEMDSGFGQAVGVYVAEKVIENVNACDRPTRLAVLYSIKPYRSKPLKVIEIANPKREFNLPESFHDNVDLISSESVSEIAAEVLRIGEENRSQRADKFRKALSRYSAKLKPLPPPPDDFARD